MYLLKRLQDAGNQTPKVEVEYRLACSGEFYSRKVVTFDWRKSDMTRVLLEHPFPLFVTSRPFDSYPQELCVRIPLNFVREEAGRGSRVFLPDDDVVEDLCAILSLLSRRLVSVVTKTREKTMLRTPHGGTKLTYQCQYSITQKSMLGPGGRVLFSQA